MISSGSQQQSGYIEAFPGYDFSQPLGKNVSLQKSFIMAHHLHSDVLPGTVHLVDLAGTLNVRHEEGGEKDIVLLPQPTNEYDDPLNWTRPRKLLSVNLMLLAVLSGSEFPYHKL